MSTPKTLFTIGHSTHTINFFVELLQQHTVDVIVDVRSVPYSQYADQFNQEPLKATLSQNNMYYLYMGDCLGARYEDQSLLFDDGKVDFEKVKRSAGFQNGITRVQDGLKKGHRIAIMCSEKNPVECHRFSMISRYLDENGIIVKHILPDKVYGHKELENKIFGLYNASGKVETNMDKIAKIKAIQQTMFANKTVSDLYQALNLIVAYTSEGQEEEFV